MTQETLLLIGVQALLGVLVTIGLRWTASISADVEGLRREIARANEGLVATHGRISSLESLMAHDSSITNSRLERVTGRVSDLRGEMGRIGAIVSLCKNCPQIPKDAGHD